jgi:hypothetical protein
MLWDGKSKGTISNVVNLLSRQKVVVVYVAPVKAFETLRSAVGLQVLLAKGDPQSVERLVTELGLDLLRPAV